MGLDLDGATVLAVVRAGLADLLDADPASVGPETAVVLLNIDSLTAAELIVNTQAELGIDIDFKELARDWSEFTVADLANELARCAKPPSYLDRVRTGDAVG